MLLCWELNSKPLPRDNGYPLRVIVPGVIGARSVKWLRSIRVRKGESPGFYTKKDYKIFPASVQTKKWADSKWLEYQSILALNVNTAMCNVQPD